MHLPRSITRRAAIAAVLMAATAAASVPALAASNAAAPAPSTPSAQSAGQRGQHGHGDIGIRLARELIGQVATLTRQTTKQVREQLRAGKTLNQIAGSQAGPAEAATLKEVQARLDKAVAAGKLTQPQADKLLAKAKTGLDKLMSKHFPAKPATAAGSAAK